MRPGPPLAWAVPHGMAAREAAAGGGGVRGEHGGARSARPLRAQGARRHGARDHPRLHRRLLGRHPLPRQPGLLPPVLDPRPELQRAVAGAHLARAPGAGHRLVRLGDAHLGAAREPRHDHHPLLRPAGGRVRLRRRLPAAHGGGAASDRRGRHPARASVLAGGGDPALHGRGRRRGDRARAQRPQVQRAPRHDRQPMQRVRQQHGRPAGHDGGRPGLGDSRTDGAAGAGSAVDPARALLGRARLLPRLAGRHHAVRARATSGRSGPG